MGGDGGVIANQRKFLRGTGKDPSEGANKEGKNLTREQRIRATTCALTNQKFIEPLVCCELGNIYNKESVLQGLLDKSLNEIFPHIRGLKDLKTLRITKNPAAHEESDVNTPYIVCPITKLEMNGLQPFVILWSTGFVLSEKAVKEVGVDALQDEYGPFEEKDIVKLLPTEAELDASRAAMFHRRAAQDAKKAAKQAKKKAAEEKESAAMERVGEDGEDGEEGTKIGKKRKSDDLEQVENPLDSVPAPSLSVAPAKKSSSGKVVSSAMNAIKESEEKSSVYKNLFHKNNEKDRKDRDLFMTVAGLRYTLG